MIVVYSGTRNLYECMLPSITSLLEHNNPEKVYILIEDDTFPYPLPEVCETINVSALKNRFNPLSPNMSSVFTYMAMIRIMYVDIFPQYDKVIQHNPKPTEPAAPAAPAIPAQPTEPVVEPQPVPSPGGILGNG